MDHNFIIAQVFGVLGIIFSVLSMQMKNKKETMIMLLLLNLASAFNFLFLGSYSGSYVCFFAVFETFINYLYDKKGKNVPWAVIAFYVVVNIALGLSTYTGIIDIIPIVCALLFCGSICTKKVSDTRNLMFANQSLWLIYDIVVKAYFFACSNVLTLVSYVIAMVRFRKQKK